jgi:hypothetical protein
MEKIQSPLRRLVSLGAPLIALVATAGPGSATAQQPQAGELWRQTVTFEADGMAMPPKTMEICLPTTTAQVELRRPPQEDMSCRFLDLKESGGRSSGRMECKTDEGPLTGTFETLTEGNRVRSTINLVGPEGRMTFRRDASRIGTACTTMQDQAEALQQQATVNAERMRQQQCGSALDQLRANPANIAYAYVYFAGPTCGEASQRAEFCAVLASPAGYRALHAHDLAMRDARTREGLAQTAQPLRDSASACGYGTGDKAVTSLRARATDEARKLFARGETPLPAADLLVLEGTDADYTMLRTTALGKCQGMLFTSARRAGGDFCGAYGMALARNDRAAVRAIADGRDPGSAATGTAAPGVVSPGTGGTATVPVPEPARPPAAAPAKPGLGDLLRRGRGVLDGVLGR